MSSIRRAPASSSHSLILLILPAAVHSLAFAQAGSVELPENARAQSYGSEWACERGYQVAEEACVAVNSCGERSP